MALQRELVCGQNLVIGVSGDVDPDAIAQALSIRLEALPAGRRFAPPVDAPAPGDIRRAFLASDRAQNHLVLGFAGLTVDDPDRDALEVVAQVLAGGVLGTGHTQVQAERPVGAGRELVAPARDGQAADHQEAATVR